MIENTLYFIVKKLEINKNKLLDDFNNIWLKLNSTQKFTVVDKHNFFILLKLTKV